jgi:hypothetical protein
VRKEAAFFAGLAMLLALSWQWLTVQFNAAGNWTVLYHTGERSTLPPQLAVEDIRQIPESSGYDGQFYHYIAHDPFLTRGLQAYVDNPRLRWRRILLPGLAWLLAFGSDDFVDSVYFGLVLASVFAGAYWLSAVALDHGKPAWLGLLFLAVPATVVSLDRMTVDGTLVALALGVLYVAPQPRSAGLWILLASTPLVRETGVLLVLAFALHCAAQKHWRRAAFSVASLAPFALWTLYVHSKTAADQTTWTAVIPFAGLLTRTLHPVQYSIESVWLQWAAVFDYLALLGLWLAIVLALRLSASRLTSWAAWSFVALAAVLTKLDIWADAYAFGRTLSPLLVFLAVDGLSRPWRGLVVSVLPIAMMLPRILLQFSPQWKGVLHGLAASLR